MITVKFYAGLRKITGARETTLAVDSLRNALDALALQEQVWDGVRLRPHVIVTINGHPLDPAGGIETPLNAGDVLAIFPPIAGG
jgi:molybdopterin synthase sulfur carrier subunit